jgi:hypothetical protein
VKTCVKWTYRVLSMLSFIVGGWLASPLLLKYYINHKIEVVRVESAQLKSIDCVQLTKVSIKVENTSGVLDHVTACRKAKTIDADGGVLDISIKGDGPKKSSGYKITAKNITAIVHIGDRVINVSGARLTPEMACGTKANIKLGDLGEIQVGETCVDLKTKRVTCEGGRYFVSQILGHPVGVIDFKNGTFDPDTKVGDVGLLTREPFTVQGLHVEIQGHQATLKATRIVGSHKRIYKDPLTLKDVVVGPIDIDAPFDRAVQASLKGASFTFDVRSWHVEGKEPCQEWLDAVPDELKEGPISEMQLTGNFAIDLTMKPEVRLKISNQCSLTKGPPPKFIQALSRRFKYTAYHPDGKPFERETGPGSAEWIPLQMISPNMATALTTTEDPGFMYHRGIIPQAIENSLKDNLKLGRFFRGGSTLTMQLAKNLWLSRTRTLGRKLQEAILTVALESALPKDKILELYLNIVEFGPNLYGVGSGAREVLHKDPLELTLTDAMYLVLRLPAPNHSASYEGMKGMIGKLLDNAMRAGKVTEDMVAIEKGQLTTVNFEDD